MSRRDFRIGWRLLIRQPLQSGIELLGLAAGFAICFLMLGFARYSFDYDRDVPQREQVYLIKHRLNFIPQPQWMEYTPFALREVAQHSGLPLEVSAWWPRQAVVRIQNMPLKIEVTLVDPAFERIAGLRALQGDLQQALTQPNALALTEGSARRLFGDEAALGRTLDINGQRVTVRAILPDRPANSTLQFGVLAGVSSVLWSQQELREGLANWMSIAGRIYVKTAPGVRPEALQQVLQGVIDRAPWGDIATPAMKAALGERKMVDIALGPLADAYFDRSVANTMGTGARGDRRLVLAMAAAGLLILALAALNYINLAAMRVVRRQREIAVRRVLGAGTGRLLSQFMAEAVLLSGAAAAVGLLLAWLLLPVASTLLGHTLDGMFIPATIVACLVLGVLLGVVAGLYPGWLARGVDMRSALNLRSSETAGGAWLRRILTALQFGAAMAMGGIALAIVWQTRFAAEANAGFDATPLLVVEMPESIDQPRAAAFRDALARLPGVAAVADSRNVPGRDDGSGTRGSTTVQRDDGSSTAMAVQWVGADFFKVYGVTALAGQLFDSRMKPGSIPIAQPGAAQPPEQGVVLNDAAVRALGWPSAAQAIGQRIHGTGYRVLGVAPDIRWQTLREPAGPLMYQVAQDSRLLTLRMAPGHSSAQLETAIVATASRYFSMPLPAIRSAGSYPALAYAADLRLAQMLGSATLVLLALAAFGVYAMAAVGVQRKTREIVLRKLHGAGRRAIARLVGREFVLLTASAALLGLPLAVLGIERYLAPFVAHSPLCGWAPLAALALAGLTVLLAAARHTLAALRLPPLQALRD